MDINALRAGWEEDFVREMADLRSDSIRESFRRGFAKSLAGQLTPVQYEKETGWDFDTAEELQAHLRSLWVTFYGADDPGEYLS
jgi:hypothetical protein